MNEKQTSSESWFGRKRRERAERALERQLEYQEEKAESIAGDEQAIVLGMMEHSQKVRRMLEELKPIEESARILEVGSGAHGLIFQFGGKFGVGIDPLAVDYKRLFPAWQKNAQTVAAIGEQLPFDDASFDVVLSDNVIDHAEEPVKIIEELARVLKPSGLLYFSVNVHHPIYSAASGAHGFWNALGLRYELSPFADHTVHFTAQTVRQVFSRLPFRVVSEATYFSDAPPRHRLERTLKKLFFKNALFEIVAVRETVRTIA